ncbi:MAG: hypothetical protein EBY59_04610 [Proteobacteria bacterium]|nr:hypothetical protein [Pseudomonadota bacterium]
MNKKICFFCVGTGGHVLPVRNIIRELKALGTKNEDIFVICDNRGRQYLDNLDVRIHTPEIFVSKKGLVGYIFNIFTISRSIREVTKILKDQNISVVLTTGAYIAPVAAIVSKILKAKFFIQEQNIYAGLGNKMSAIFAKTIFTSFEDTKNINRSKLKHTGPVVNTTLGRKNIEPIGVQTIGFVGGSQGSEEINNYVEQFLNNEASSEFNVLHITGKAKNIYKLEPQNYKSYEFLNDMDIFYKEIDILVGRAGGGSLEAAYLGIPQILVPYKHGTTSSHQDLNARYLENKKFGFKVNSFDELLRKVSEISVKIKSNNLDIPEILIGNQSIAKEIYEYIN